MVSCPKSDLFIFSVVKEPPYSVKESGYAGFALPIEIHLRNKDEPKKVSFHYDLNLQQAGAPIIKVQKEKYIFNSPNEEFKLKLLKGGGSVSVFCCSVLVFVVMMKV